MTSSMTCLLYMTGSISDDMGEAGIHLSAEASSWLLAIVTPALSQTIYSAVLFTTARPSLQPTDSSNRQNYDPALPPLLRLGNSETLLGTLIGTLARTLTGTPRRRDSVTMRLWQGLSLGLRD